MKTPANFVGPDMRALFALFAPGNDMPEYEFVAPDEVPPPYHGLLVHEHHMTVTVEAHHGGPVDVRVLARRHDGDSYARKILLALQSTGRIVQFGIARVNLGFCSQAVRAEILAAGTPLGRILIQHNVLRRIEPTAFLRVLPGPDMMEWFSLKRPQPTYGRLAYIHCDSKPAIELLEIVAPEPALGSSRDVGERRRS
jgi:chorismate-pyruvate lyase